MKPRSTRLREDARLSGTFSLLLAFATIAAGSAGCLFRDWQLLFPCLASFAAAFILFVATIALFIDMIEGFRAAEREDFWERKASYDKFSDLRS